MKIVKIVKIDMPGTLGTETIKIEDSREIPEIMIEITEGRTNGRTEKKKILIEGQEDNSTDKVIALLIQISKRELKMTAIEEEKREPEEVHEKTKEAELLITHTRKST